jgi:hypothetical protein
MMTATTKLRHQCAVAQSTMARCAVIVFFLRAPTMTAQAKLEVSRAMSAP